MMQSLKNLLVPVVRFTRYSSFMWHGDYPSWEEAMARCTGYDAAPILEKCVESLRAVLEGKARYERDSLLFNDLRLNWELLALVQQVALRRDRVRLLDFGGSLGSLYFQHKKWLDEVPMLQWDVVEQPHFAAAGKKEAEDGRLRFFDDLDQALQHGAPDVLLLSGVLQTMEKPYEWARRLSDAGATFVMLDRVPVTRDLDREVLTVQKVAPHIYEASYPCWFFPEGALPAAFTGYEEINAFPSQYDFNQWVNGRRCTWKGYVLTRNTADLPGPPVKNLIP